MREGLLGVEGRVEARRGDAACPERIDLVLHQGDQRRDHQGEAVEQQRGQLVAERLAAAGGKDREGRAAGEQGLDDRFLAVAEGGEAEVGLEGVGEGAGHAGVWNGECGGGKGECGERVRSLVTARIVMLVCFAASGGDCASRVFPSGLPAGGRSDGTVAG